MADQKTLGPDEKATKVAQTSPDDTPQRRFWLAAKAYHRSPTKSGYTELLAAASAWKQHFMAENF